MTVHKNYDMLRSLSDVQVTSPSAGSLPLWSATLAAFADSVRAWACGTTPTVAASLKNTSPAALGAQQYSPASHWGGQTWDTGTGTSRATDCIAYLYGVQGNPASSGLIFAFSVGGGAYSTAATMMSNGLLYVNSITTLTGAIYAATYCRGTALYAHPTASATAQLAQLVMGGTSWTEGLKTMVITETLTANAVEVSMTSAVPKGSVIRAVLANVQTELTGGGTTETWSLGITGDVDKYGTAGFPTQADSLAKNSKSSWISDAAPRLAADETIKLCAAATGGASAGDTALTVGTVKVVVIYDTFGSLANA